MKEEKLINMILGSHAHVPSGAPESEFEYVYENKIRPFVSNLYRYSNIQAVLHYSGVLLYWVERNHPELFMLMEDMVLRKQAEILGGGFFEPSFTLIPLQDRIGQIEFMTTYLRKHFGKRPAGCWIPGMVWEQHLVSALNASGMNFTFLSQEQFVLAGMKGEQLFSPCISEDQGKILFIFPVSLSVENDLAAKSFSQVFVELKSKLDKSCGKTAALKLISIFPDKILSSAEEAPDTVWNRFFEEISLSESIVETTLPSKIIKNQKTFKKACFPNSSAYPGNFSPRQFILNHAEANGIYSKMIFTNVLINQLKGDKSRKLNAREELWKAQDSYLFSPGDGQNRNELRKAAFSSLLRAEKLTRDKGKFISSLIQYDFDSDGKNEFLFQDAKINCYIQLKGAGIFELDYLPTDWNYVDCGSVETGQRTAFADIITSSGLLINEETVFKQGESRLCFNEQYEALSQDKKGKSCFKLSACAEDEPFGKIEINKCYLLKRDALVVSYLLKNTGKEKLDFQFIPEIDFSFAGIGDEFVRFYKTDSNGKDIHLEKLFESDNLKILDVKNEVQIILASIKVFSGCLLTALFKDYNSIDFYQATRILPVFSVNLDTNETWTNEFTLKFSH